ncbi:MAG: hypothetical protein K1X88_32830 [Nannocystaceae bacterium]|nr:hypothetical protein [Nannocystaceae bacterium]
MTPPPRPRPEASPTPTLAVPGGLAAPSLDEPDAMRDAHADDARLALAQWREAIARTDDAAHRGRLHYECGRLCELLHDTDGAQVHYAQALLANADHLPSIVAARRVALRRGAWDATIELFDREIRLTADRQAKAALSLCKGRVLEDRLRRIPDAHQAYAAAIELSDPDPALFHALEQLEHRAGSWEALDRLYEASANTLSDEPSLRAALLCQRARLRELHRRDDDGAAQLYAQAFELDVDAPGAAAALERLHARRGRFRELVALLEREAQLVVDPGSRALVLHRAAMVTLERIGDRAGARALLERGDAIAPKQPVILDALARVYEEGAQWPELVRTLATLVELTPEPHERLGLLQRVGLVCLDGLDDREGAIVAFEAVLEIDASHVPALRALAPLYAATQRWDALVTMHRGEAAASREPRRRATAHARAGEILERIEREPEAIAEHEHALALAPDLLPSFEALVRLLTRAERHRALVELYERQLERFSAERRIEALFAIGDLHRGPLADPEQAEFAYRRILQQRPQHLGAIHALARVATAAGRWRSLIDALELEAGLVTEPAQRADLLHRVGEILDEHLGRREEAVTKLRAVLTLDAGHAGTLATLGRIFHAEGRWADLADIYQRELDATTDTATQVVLLHKLGELHARHLAAPDRAAEFLRRALDLDPRDPPSLQALSRILRAQHKWRELASLAELERDGYRDPATRALASFQLGLLYEERLDDRAAAERCYALAVELHPGYRPAADALARVRTELGHFAPLVDELERAAATQIDPRQATATMMRAGEVARDHLRDPARARACFERVLASEPGNVGALLALEALQRDAGDLEGLSRTLLAQARTFQAGAARAMAWGERARVLELGADAATDTRVEALSGVLAVREHDRAALASLEREALASGDPRIIASVDGRLAAAVDDPLLRAALLTRRAEALEASGGPQALDVYREVIALDPENLGAIRGLARLAEVLGDSDALVEVAEHEASIAKTPAEAADAWTRAGVTRIEQIGDRGAAVRAFDKALQLWPDHELAATRLTQLMRQQGQLDKLAERLLRAAGQAQQPARSAALWLEVARLYAKELDNLGAAIHALETLLAAQPQQADALLQLSELYLADRRADDAIGLLRRAVQVARGEGLGEAHFLLAVALEDKGDPPGAFKHYEMALQQRPGDERVLARVVALQLDSGLFGAAVDSATRLREQAGDEDAAVRADIALAQAYLGVRKVDEAIDALADAIALEGTGGVASTELHRIATTPEHWQRYLAALRQQLEAAQERRPMLYLELARTQRERLGEAEAARATLIEGLRACNGDAGLRFELANDLRLAHRYGDAVDQLQQVLMDDVTRIEAWRALARAFDDLQQPRARGLANAVLVVLEVASPAEREDLRQWQPRTDAIRPAALAGDATADLHVARDQQAPSAALLASIVDGLAKIRPADLGRWGVASRDRMRTEQPMRQLVDRIAGMFAIEEYDVYQHALRDRGVFVENTSKPSILVPAWLAEQPASQQVFAIATAVINLSRGLFTIDLFTPRELEILVAAAARTFAPGFGETVAAPDVLDDHMRTLGKAVSRKRRRAFEIAAEAFPKTRGPDTATFIQWVRQSARRIALLVADDLPASLGTVARAEGISGKLGVATMRTSPVLADLVRVWVSRPAMTLRYACGLLPTRPG